MIIPPQYNQAISFSEGLAAVQTNNQKWGYIDTTGKFMIEPQYDNAYNFKEGFAVVWLDKKCDFIDKTGKLIYE